MTYTLQSIIKTGQYDGEMYADSSGSDGDNNPWNAFDGSLSNGVLLYGSSNCWLSADFTVEGGSAKPINAASVTCAAFPSNATIDQTFCPKDFKFQYSVDGLSWTDAFSITNVTDWVAGAKKYFDFGSTYTQNIWRILISANNGSAFGTAIAEMEYLIGSDPTANPAMFLFF